MPGRKGRRGSLGLRLGCKVETCRIRGLGYTSRAWGFREFRVEGLGFRIVDFWYGGRFTSGRIV